MLTHLVCLHTLTYQSSRRLRRDEREELLLILHGSKLRAAQWFEQMKRESDASSASTGSAEGKTLVVELGSLSGLTLPADLLPQTSGAEMAGSVKLFAVCYLGTEPQRTLHADVTSQAQGAQRGVSRSVTVPLHNRGAKLGLTLVNSEGDEPVATVAAIEDVEGASERVRPGATFDKLHVKSSHASGSGGGVVANDGGVDVSTLSMEELVHKIRSLDEEWTSATLRNPIASQQQHAANFDHRQIRFLHSTRAQQSLKLRVEIFAFQTHRLGPVSDVTNQLGKVGNKEVQKLLHFFGNSSGLSQIHDQGREHVNDRLVARGWLDVPSVNTSWSGRYKLEVGYIDHEGQTKIAIGQAPCLEVSMHWTKHHRCVAFYARARALWPPHSASLMCKCPHSNGASCSLLHRSFLTPPPPPPPHYATEQQRAEQAQDVAPRRAPICLCHADLREAELRKRSGPGARGVDPPPRPRSACALPGRRGREIRGARLPRLARD